MFWCCSWPTAGATPAAQNERHAAWESFVFKKRAPRCMGALLAGHRRHQMFQKPSPRSMGIIFVQKKRTPRFMGALLPLKGAQDHPRQKNAVFASKSSFGTTTGVLHYVLRREIAILPNKYNFELEICAKARGGRTARCMGDVPVADLLASEARRARTSGPVSSAYGHPSLCLFPGDRSRESCGTLQLPQTTVETYDKKLYFSLREFRNFLCLAQMLGF